MQTQSLPLQLQMNVWPFLFQSFTNDGMTQGRRYFLLLWQSFQFYSHSILASPGTILLVGELIV